MRLFVTGLLIIFSTLAASMDIEGLVHLGFGGSWKNSLSLVWWGENGIKEKLVFKTTRGDVIHHIRRDVVSLLISGNEICQLPTEIGLLTDLIQLRITNTQITNLPTEIGGLTNLKNLYLNNNRLTSLPKEFEKLEGLDAFNLENNSSLGILQNYHLCSMHKNGSFFEQNLIFQEYWMAPECKNHYYYLGRYRYFLLTHLTPPDFDDPILPELALKISFFIFHLDWERSDNRFISMAPENLSKAKTVQK